MLASLIVVFREATAGAAGRSRWLLAGTGAGIAGALAAVVGVAILREAGDVVLFLYGIAAGGALDLGLAILMSCALYRGLTALSRMLGRPDEATPRPAWAACAALAIAAAAATPARAGEMPVSVFTPHRFYPDRLVAPAGQKLRIGIRNSDDTADEFESTGLSREKLVAPGGRITVFVGPLDPGSYQFFGDFHRDTAPGVIEAK
ncbi:MAG: cupredoxin domain-containing protein [Rhodospirillales bacterium]